MTARAKKILTILGVVLVVVFLFTLLIKYGMHLFFDNNDYLTPLTS